MLTKESYAIMRANHIANHANTYRIWNQDFPSFGHTMQKSTEIQIIQPKVKAILLHN